MPLKKRRSKPSKYLRPPIVTVMGHVDHGKTSLLDAIRKTNITAEEHGGITQHIGAYQISFKGKKITFIDTPGHVAFGKMRSRGAQVTDLVVLVIAANDGVKPQTKESLQHIKKAGVPFLVTINKIDLAGASSEMVKNQLAEENILVEGYGGDIVCVEVSAKQKKGLDEFLEMILLLNQMKPLEANPNGQLKAVIIESRLDAKQGPLATLLIKNGTLRIGDYLTAEDVRGKVKAIRDEKGKKLSQAEPSKPVEILGFKQVPPVGSQIKRVKPDVKKATLNRSGPQNGLQPVIAGTSGSGQALKKIEEIEKIKIILKADTLGTLEAIQASLPTEVEVIFASVGAVSESDVLLAIPTKSSILAFNTKVPLKTAKLAKIEGIKIKTYKIIYELLENLEKKVLKILEPTIDEEILGKLEIIAEFHIKEAHIAGCKIKKGVINKKDKLHLKRKNKILADARIKSFQKEKQEIEKEKGC